MATQTHTSDARVANAGDDLTVDHRTSAYIGDEVGATGTPHIEYKFGPDFTGQQWHIEDVYVNTRDGQNGVDFRVSQSRVDGLYVFGGQDYAFRCGGGTSFPGDQNRVNDVAVIQTEGIAFLIEAMNQSIFSALSAQRPEQEGLYLGALGGDGCDQNIFNGVNLQRPSITNSDTHDAIHIEDGNENVFDAIRVGADTQSVGDHRYALYIEAGSVGNKLGTHRFIDGQSGIIEEETPGDNDLQPERLRIRIPGTLAVATDPFRWYLDFDAWILDARAMAGTAPTGADAVVDLLLDGTTVYPTSSPPDIPDGSNVGSFAVPDTRDISAGSYLQADVTQIGSTVAGSDVLLEVRLVRL